MKITLKALSLAAVIFTLTNIAQAKSWRGIIPLHSTCEDAKRILGITKCQTTTYHLKDENVFIYFYEESCASKPPGRWNLPRGTVLELTVYPKVKPKLADLNIDESKFTQTRDPHVPDVIHYADYEEGFAFAVFPNGEANNFSYFSGKKDKAPRCPNKNPAAQRVSITLYSEAVRTLWLVRLNRLWL
jgi:hypothetical protein